MKNFKTLIATLLVALMALTPVISLADINFADPYIYTIRSISEGVEMNHTQDQVYVSDFWMNGAQSFTRAPSGLTHHAGALMTVTSKTDDSVVSKYLADKALDRGWSYFKLQNPRPGHSANRLTAEFNIKFTPFANDAFVFDVTSDVEAAAEEDKDALYDYTSTDGTTTKYYKQACPYDRYDTLENWKSYTATYDATGAVPSSTSRKTDRILTFTLMNGLDASGKNSGSVNFMPTPAAGTENIAYGLQVAGVQLVSGGANWITSSGAEGKSFYVKLTVDLEKKNLHYYVERTINGISPYIVCDQIFDATTHPGLATFFENTVALTALDSQGMFYNPRTEVTVSNYKYTTEKYDVENGEITSGNEAFTSTVKVANNLMVGGALSQEIADTVKTPMVIGASYDANGKLVATQILGNDGLPLTARTSGTLLADSDYKTLNISVSKTNELGDTATKAKVFVWKDADNMVPLAEVASYGFDN